jgi:hypothetical protein
MDYLILNEPIMIDGVDAGNFVYYEKVSDTELQVTVSNREGTIHNITVTENDIMNSILKHFNG